MDIAVIVQFATATLLPVLACVLLTLLRKRSGMARVSERSWHVIVGVVFGCIAIYGTESGISMEGAVMNVRDAAPLVAGLFFSGPAGIIAGVIGGVERWFAVMWGAGSFTQLACCLGTIFAGVYAALLRKHLFDDRMPSWPMAFAMGIVVEVLHLLLVFVTNMDQAARAFEVVRACAPPMISCVAISVALSAVAIAAVNKQPLMAALEDRGVAQIVQSRLLIGVVAAFLITIGFTWLLQTSLSRSDAENLLQLNIEDVRQEISDASDTNMLTLTHRVAAILPAPSRVTQEDIDDVVKSFGVSEVNVVDSDGIIVASSNPDFIGYDMASGEQSSEFLVLLPGGMQQQLVQSYQPISYDASLSRKYAGVSTFDGFVQVGYDAARFQADLSSHVGSAVKNRHIGQNGALVIVDESGHVKSARGDLNGRAIDRMVADLDVHEPGQLFTTVAANEECYASYDQVEGYRVVGVLPVSEADFSRDVAVLIMSFMEVLVFTALFLIIYFVIKRVVVRSIWQVNGRLSEITQGDLDVEVDVRASTEFASLSDDINQTVGALKSSIEVVQADLEMAADIQANSLPDVSSVSAPNGEYELFASMEPAKEVGGDFFDFFMVDDDHLALVVADVSGKGVPAALFMMRSKTVIKMEALSGAAPCQVLERANADLSEKNEDDMFTTAWFGILEISTGTLIYADAGHEKVAFHRDGTWELPPKPNGAVALATFDQEDYAELPERYRFRNHTVVLQPGDAVFQYTDGVTEAANAEEELFGEERLLSALTDSADASPEALLPFVRERIAGFVQDAPQFDDITMLGLRYKGHGQDEEM